MKTKTNLILTYTRVTLFTLTLSAALPAFAEEMPTESVAEDEAPAMMEEAAVPAVAEPEPAAEAPAKEAPSLKISGFVDASFVLEADQDFSTSSNSLNLDQVEIDFEKSWDKVTLRADIESFPSGGNLLSIEQAYMTTQVHKNISLTVGTFLAPIGWELIDPIDMYQFSHAMVFDYGLPAFHTGILFNASYNIVDIALYLTNGIDTYVDLDENKAAGTRIGLSPAEGINAGLSFLYHLDNVMIADLDFTVELDSVLIGGEFNFGSNVGDNGDGTWMGALLTTALTLTDDMALTIRADWFTDEAGRVSAMDATYINGTLSPSYTITDNALVLLEYRYGFMKESGASEGSGGHTLALESTYTF